MPDISMCQNEECTRKTECYRYMAKPSEYRQAYGDFNCKPGDEIDYFIPLKAAGGVK